MARRLGEIPVDSLQLSILLCSPVSFRDATLLPCSTTRRDSTSLTRAWLWPLTWPLSSDHVTAPMAWGLTQTCAHHNLSSSSLRLLFKSAIIRCRPDLMMAFRGPPSFCADATYQKFLPLRGFSPAKGFCSNLAVHQENNNFAANIISVDPVSHAAKWCESQCPAGSSLCSLLSELQAADRTFTPNVWYIDLTGERNLDVALTQVLVAA